MGFAPQTESAILDRQIRITPEETAKLKEFDGEWDTERYTDDGFGLPWFHGEKCLENAFNYSQKYSII